MLRCLQFGEEIGAIARNGVRCVIRYRENLYMIYRVSAKEHVLLCVKWNCYRGFVQTTKIVKGKICDFAAKIMEKHDVDAVRYPLTGEWYAINVHREFEQVRWGVQKIKSARATFGICAVSFVLQFLLAMALTVPTLYITFGFAREWLHVLLPRAERSMLDVAYVLIECGGCALLFLLFRHRRGLFEMLCNTAVPFGILVAVGLLKRHWWMWLLVAIGVCIVYVLSKFYVAYFEDVPQRGERVRATLITCGLVMYSVTLVFGVHGRLYTGQASGFSDMTVEQAQAEHAVLCKSLDPDVWDTLALEQKTDLLQAICDFECMYVLGCESVELHVGVTSKITVLGEYSHAEKCITISTMHVENENVYEVLNTLFHESRHAYQHAMADMYVSVYEYVDDTHKNLMPLAQAQRFYENLYDYAAAGDDFDAYYNQTVEKDSRTWANQRVKTYYYEYINP